MYITCQQCSTTYRLDEKLLKPTGSKVRCSQCKNIFIAHPPTPVDEVPLDTEPAVAAAVTPTSEAVFDQELEGIDLAELDFILDQDSDSASDVADSPEAAAQVADEPVDFNEADLDLDFEAALMGDEDVAQQSEVETAERLSDESDLPNMDMDFDLVGDDDLAADAGLSQLEEDQAPADNIETVLGDLNHDIEMVLDDFEDSLGQPESGTDEAADIVDADFDIDFDLGDDAAADDTQDLEAAGDDSDLGSSGMLSDGDDAEEEREEGEEELSLADADEFSLDGDEAPAPMTAEDDLDIGDLDSLLDDDDDVGGAEVENLDLSLDDTAAVAETPAVGEDDLDLGDLDSLLDDDDDVGGAEVEKLDLSLDDTAAVAETPAVGEDDLDLGDLDSLLDDDDDDTGDADLENLELSLDDGEDLSLDDTAAAGELQATAADDLDLGDLESMLDEPDVADEVVTEEVDTEDVELSLADSDDLAFADAGSEAPAAISDDLDLGDLDSLLDDDDDGAEADVEDAELSFDDGDATTSETELSLNGDGDGLDLSDLNDMLENDDVPMDEGGDIELSMDLEPSPAEGDAGQNDAIEDLEFELDAEFEDKPLSQTEPPIELQGAAATVDEELDLSDIQQMLEDDTLTDNASAEKWLEDQDDDLGLGGEGEIDLSEIEEAIDAADTEIDGTGLLDDDESLELDLDLDTPGLGVEEPDLDLEMESSAEPMALEDEDAEPEELDLSDLDLSVKETKSSTTTETIDGGDIELEFHIEDSGPFPEEDTGPALETAGTTSAASAQTTEVVADIDFSLEETIATEPLHDTGTGKPTPAKAPKKKGTSKSLAVIVLLALLGGGGYLGYDYVMKNNIRVPYLSDFINPKPKDPTGTLNLSTLEINSKFLENEKSGRLFIVTGKVRNGNDVPCKMVRLKGKLFTKGKVLSKTEYTFAGVIIPDQDLAIQGLVEMKKQLTATLGAVAGAQVMAGQTIPFMLIFSELPDDLDEFAIELVSATKIE